ncbi:MAG: phosphotransferase family protein [Candidatus Dadabacteria bacterium]|nr:MAG: phosphotransferase family protein [Candidatus Dadabacteria bacterium]
MLKQLDLDKIAAGLTPWLRSKYPQAEEVRVENLERPSLGMSNETALFDLVRREGGREHRERLVARIMPTDRLVFPEYDLARQYRIMQCLAKTDVPVPAVRWFEEDASVLGAPFYIMEAVEGQAPSDVPPYHSPVGMCYELSEEERARLWWAGIETLARIHLVDWRAVGLDFLGAPSNPREAMERELAVWLDYFEWARDEEPQPILEAGAAWLREHLPTPARMTLCWGDARLPNMLFRNLEVVAVLDWEMAFIGDPIADVAWWLFLDWNHSDGYSIPRLPGFPGREETLARYEELTGFRVENLHYYEVFGAFRFGAIMAKVAQIMREAGLPMPSEDFASNNPCTHRLADLLGLPRPGQGG